MASCIERLQPSKIPPWRQWEQIGDEVEIVTPRQQA